MSCRVVSCRVVLAILTTSLALNRRMRTRCVALRKWTFCGPEEERSFQRTPAIEWWKENRNKLVQFSQYLPSFCTKAAPPAGASRYIDVAETVTMLCTLCGHSCRETVKDFGQKSFSLVKCSSCGGTCDKYVEFELALVVIDLILHQVSAYRHVIFNRLPFVHFGLQSTWKCKHMDVDCT